MNEQKMIEELAEEQARKVVGITKLAIETFKERYKRPDDLTPLVKIQFLAGAAAAFKIRDQREKKLVEALEKIKASPKWKMNSHAGQLVDATYGMSTIEVANSALSAYRASEVGE